MIFSDGVEQLFRSLHHEKYYANNIISSELMVKLCPKYDRRAAIVVHLPAVEIIKFLVIEISN